MLFSSELRKSRDFFTYKSRQQIINVVAYQTLQLYDSLPLQKGRAAPAVFPVPAVKY